MVTEIDLHIGKKLRRIRRIRGMTLQQVAEASGIKFQRIQKYECDGGRISASALYHLAKALYVPIGYFFEGLDGESSGSVANDSASDVLPFDEEALEFIRACEKLTPKQRRYLLDVAQGER